MMPLDVRTFSQVVKAAEVLGIPLLKWAFTGERLSDARVNPHQIGTIETWNDREFTASVYGLEGLNWFHSNGRVMDFICGLPEEVAGMFVELEEGSVRSAIRRWYNTTQVSRIELADDKEGPISPVVRVNVQGMWIKLHTDDLDGILARFGESLFDIDAD